MPLLLRFDHPFWMMGLSLRVLWPVLAVVLGVKAVSPSPPEPADGPMAVQTDVACCGMLWHVVACCGRWKWLGWV